MLSNSFTPHITQPTTSFIQRRLLLQSASALGITGIASISAPALAQATWPTKPVRIILPFPAGATSDVLCRVLTERLSAALGQPFTIDNKVGAGGTLGSAEAAKAAPDGYNLLWGTVSSLAVAPALFPNAGYDPATSFAPIAQVFRIAHVVSVPAAHPAKTLQELLAMARDKPGTMSYASSGNGTISHLIGELLLGRTGTKMLHVPYRSAPAGQADHISGRIDVRFDTMVDGRPAVSSGQTRALAVTSATRAPSLPNVPTMAEAGVPDFVVTGWFAFAAPAGTPDAITQRMSSTLADILQKKDTLDALAPHGVEVAHLPPAQLREHISREAKRFGDLVRQLNIQPG
ncbi:MAG: tripartite tricarboxylate transporter substrate binding protein [Burkholderiales bacterium]|nr:MAG: tripartite tricarboxylate transporter substrate binding protein [Burkholderiales bacterium]